MELERRESSLLSQQKHFNSTLRTTESASKSLRDEVSRLKVQLQQVRTQSANDLRKRDVQIGKLKDRLLDARRNPKASNTIIINGIAAGYNPTIPDNTEQLSGCQPDCLAQDTADALTEISQTLADENDNLVSIANHAINTIGALLGKEDDSLCVPGLDRTFNDEFLVSTPRSFDTLSDKLTNLLEGLRDLINQPNYVAIEELEARDSEIERLKTKNAVIEEEWKKAIGLIDQWNANVRDRETSAHDVPLYELERIPEEDEQSEGKTRTKAGNAGLGENKSYNMADSEIVLLDVDSLTGSRAKKDYGQTQSSALQTDGDKVFEDLNDVSLDEEQLQREASMMEGSLHDFKNSTPSLEGPGECDKTTNSIHNNEPVEEGPTLLYSVSIKQQSTT